MGESEGASAGAEAKKMRNGGKAKTKGGRNVKSSVRRQTRRLRKVEEVKKREEQQRREGIEEEREAHTRIYKKGTEKSEVSLRMYSVHLLFLCSS